MTQPSNATQFRSGPHTIFADNPDGDLKGAPRFYYEQTLVLRGGRQAVSFPNESGIRDSKVVNGKRVRIGESLASSPWPLGFRVAWPAGSPDIDGINLTLDMHSFVVNRFEEGGTMPDVLLFDDAEAALAAADSAVYEGSFHAVVVTGRADMSGVDDYAQPLNHVDDPLESLSVVTELPPGKSVLDFTQPIWCDRKRNYAARLIRELGEEVLRSRARIAELEAQ